MNKPPSVIRLSGISKVFQTDQVDTHALADIDLRIETNEFVSISGPSGCGKSTLLSIIGLLDEPSSGDYHLNGQHTGTISQLERSSLRNREIGFVFQNFNLIGDMTVRENVELPLSYRGITKKERRQRVEEVLEKVGMIHRENHFPSQLSGGQQQRVAVARALGGAPAILLADEPTGNLDSENSIKIMELFTELHREGATICMVTHNLSFNRFATRTIHLLDGKIVGTPLRAN